MSEPAEKFPSVPRRMRTSISGARSIAAMMSGSANHMSRDRAPSFCGRSIVSVPIAPSSSKRKPSTRGMGVWGVSVVTGVSS